MHLSSWLATIWRSSSSSRVSLSNWSSCEETLMAAFTRLQPARRRHLSRLTSVGIKAQTVLVFWWTRLMAGGVLKAVSGFKPSLKKRYCWKMRRKRPFLAAAPKTRPRGAAAESGRDRRCSLDNGRQAEPRTAGPVLAHITRRQRDSVPGGVCGDSGVLLLSLQ